MLYNALVVEKEPQLPSIGGSPQSAGINNNEKLDLLLKADYDILFIDSLVDAPEVFLYKFNIAKSQSWYYKDTYPLTSSRAPEVYYKYLYTRLNLFQDIQDLLVLYHNIPEEVLEHIEFMCFWEFL